MLTSLIESLLRKSSKIKGRKKKGQFKGTERFKKKPTQMQLKNPVKN